MKQINLTITNGNQMVSLSSPEWVPLEYTGNNGCYSAAMPNERSKEILVLLGKMLGYEIDPGTLHCTLVYSKKPLTKVPEKIKKFEAKCIEVKHWKGHDNKTYIVANLESEDLNNANKRLTELGAEHSFDDYTPHVTLNCSEEEPSEDVLKRIAHLNRIIKENEMNFIFVNQFIGDLKK